MSINKIREREPFVIILIGPPLSGKTTWVKNNFSDIEVISRDDILMESCDYTNYNEAFNNVDQKNVDKLLLERFKELSTSKKNVIVDMTHMGSKRRKYNLSHFGDDYYKVGVIFPFLKEKEYIKRNEKRVLEEDKDISMNVVNNMISNFVPIKSDEGFNKIISL